MYSQKIRKLTLSAMIAALYVILTYIAHVFGLASGAIQIRISEAITVLPYFTSAAIPGLFVGCILANLLTGCAVWDIVFGSLATLIGAIAASLLRNKSKWLAPVPNILSNSVIVPFVLIYVYGLKEAYYIHFASVFLGEIISCGILGMILLFVLEKHRNYIFKN